MIDDPDLAPAHRARWLALRERVEHLTGVPGELAVAGVEVGEGGGHVLAAAGSEPRAVSRTLSRHRHSADVHTRGSRHDHHLRVSRR